MPSRSIPIEEASPSDRRIRDAVVCLLRYGPASQFPEGLQDMGSGFLTEISEDWFLCTADHVIDDVLDEGKFSGPRFLLKSNDPFKQPIPYAYRSENALRLKRWALEQKASGGELNEEVRYQLDYLASCDFCVIRLEKLYIDALRVAGAQPFKSSEVWNPESPPDGFSEAEDLMFMIAGFPSNARSVDREKNSLDLSINLLPVWPETYKGARLAFRPEWPTDLRPGDVKGMSGGPAVVTFRSKVYWFGAQSGQYGVPGKTPSKLFIAQACRLMPMIEEVLRISRQNAD